MIDLSEKFRLNFKDKTVLITGGTRGIGNSLVNDFLSLGARVISTGTSQLKIDELNEIEMKLKRGLTWILGDFSSDAGIELFLDKLSRIQQIDICINNAGTNKNNSLENVSKLDIDTLLNINLKAPLLICQTVAKSMIERSISGKIVNIGSIWSVISKKGRSIYSTTKTGLAGFSRSIAVDLAPHGILVNVVSPGFTRTELTEAMLTPEEIRELASQVPLNRIASTEEISKVVIFLSSNLNTFLTAQNIVVDGGFSSV